MDAAASPLAKIFTAPVYRKRLKKREFDKEAAQIFGFHSRLARGNGRLLQTQKFAPPPCQIYEFISCEWYNVLEGTEKGDYPKDISLNSVGKNQAVDIRHLA